MAELARAYIDLALAIDYHHPGFVDGYFGPNDWKPKEPRALADLTKDAAGLMSKVRALEDPTRRTFLEAQVRAMETTVALLMGEELPFAEEVRLLYDVEVAHVPEARFDEALTTLADLLPGRGDIAGREHALRATFEVPKERMTEVVSEIVEALRERTKSRVSLPEGESVEVRLVADKPWSGYNWYLGGYRSCIDINLDLPVHLYELPNLLAHEAYPGHHTELAIKEQLLYHEAGRTEHAVLLLNAPESVVREGIAVWAERMVLQDDELRGWLADDLSRLAEIGPTEVDTMLEVRRVKRALLDVWGNAALLLHAEGTPEAEVRAYLERYGLATAGEAQKAVEFLTQPLSRGYVFTYLAGEALLSNLFHQGDSQVQFARLLAEPGTPGLVRGWLRIGADNAP
jgi:hypothetical protein